MMTAKHSTEPAAPGDVVQLHVAQLVAAILTAVLILLGLIALTWHTVASVGPDVEPTPDPTLTAPSWSPSVYQAGRGPGTPGQGLGVLEAHR